MKKVLSLALIGVLALSLTACFDGGSSDIELDVNELWEEMQAALPDDQKIMGQSLDEAKLLELYGLDDTLVESFVSTIPMMSAQIDETTIIKATEGNAEKVKEKILKRQEVMMTDAFYPELVEHVENYKLVVNGDYVIFAVGPHAETYVKSFESKFE